MTLQGLIEFWRKQVSDESAPYLWDDDEALLFAIDAQDQFVRKMGGFSVNTVDAASDPTNLQLHDLVLTPNVPSTTFSPYILRIRSAKLMTAKLALKIISEAEAPYSTVQSHDYSFGRTTKFLDDTDVGTVEYAIVGLTDNALRWVKVPTVADTCRLHVYRLPFPRITSQDSALEIDEQHHMHLSLWMKHLAYSKEDGETYDKTLADKNADAFWKYCERAAGEKDRQRFKPRVVQYGGL